MVPTRTTSLGPTCDTALAAVAATRATLLRVRQAEAPLTELRAAYENSADALDAALGAARASGAAGRPLVRELLTQRDLLVLGRRDTRGMNVPDCAQTASLDADGPDTPGLSFESVDAHGPGTAHMHGLDLSAAIEPTSRARAGQAGPHADHQRQTAPRWVQEPAVAAVH
jgi:hypothetical protein